MRTVDGCAEFAAEPAKRGHGRIFDTTGSYDAAWLMAIAPGAASALLHLPIQEQALPLEEPEMAQVQA